MTKKVSYQVNFANNNFFIYKVRAILFENPFLEDEYVIKTILANYHFLVEGNIESYLLQIISNVRQEKKYIHLKDYYVLKRNKFTDKNIKIYLKTKYNIHNNDYTFLKKVVRNNKLNNYLI